MSDITDPKPDDLANPVASSAASSKTAEPARPLADPFAAAAPGPSGEIVVRRGGIGLMTATALSTLAAVGGAYLALFIQARPDLMVSTGLARVLPQSDTAAVVEPAVTDRIAALETDLSKLEARVAAMAQATPQGSAPQGAAPQGAAPQAPAPAAASPASPAAPASPTVKASPPGTSGPTPPGPTSRQAEVAPGTPAQQAQAVPPTQAPALVPGPTTTELAALGGRVTAIETRLAALDPTGAGGAVIAGLQTEIATLKVLVARLQGQVDSAPPARVTMAVVALAEAASRNGPFLQEFEAVRAALPALPEATSLQELARTGAPSRTLLAERFTGLAPAIAALDAQSRDEGGLTGWFRSIIAGLIRVEEPPTTEGTGSTALLTRAKLKLDQGDLAGAIAEVGGITPQPDAVRAWLAGAKARLELERKLAALRGAVESGRVANAAIANGTVANGTVANGALSGTGAPAAEPGPVPGTAPPVGIIPSTPPSTSSAPATKETAP
ncbi:MAG: mitofilin family membrane protein [Hyphomonadaceae bacterium]|nr:mitofilin family membrane protein [Hyphomonadaceae bacterium]